MPIGPFIWATQTFEVPTAKLMDVNYARERMKDFDPERATLSRELAAGQWTDESEDTMHYSLIDKDGMMVAITTTLNSSFGSQLVIPGTGILMNNEMDDFSAQPGVPNQFGLLGAEANAIQPMKRMLSSMTPTLVTRDGVPFSDHGFSRWFNDHHDRAPGDHECH